MNHRTSKPCWQDSAIFEITQSFWAPSPSILFSVLLGGATALLPIFAKDILHTGPWGLGLLRAAPSVGAVLMSLVLARYTIKRHAGKLMFGAVGVFGVATIVFRAFRKFLRVFHSTVYARCIRHD